MKSFLEKHEWIIPSGLFIVFLAFTLPGISWGAPDFWHVDEIVVRSIKALHGEWKFSEINFDYPDLPQYTMFFLGKLLLLFGKTDGDILIASRVLSAVLTGLTIVLAYVIARRMGGSIQVAGLSGLLLLCVSELAHNGRFAHNDTYLAFFTTLSILFLILFQSQQNRIWLYASFMTVGMAASSKYIGGSLVLAPVAVYLASERDTVRKNPLSFAETLFIGGALTFLGYAAGTPKALFWMSYYFKRILTALNWQVNYGRSPDSIRGIAGQYPLIAEGTGAPLFWLFVAGFLWTCYQVIQAHRNGALNRKSRAGFFATLLLAIVTLDLPIMISYNYQIRYFLTFMPLLAILAAFFLEELYIWSKQNLNPLFPKAIIAGVSLIVLYSFARLVSVMLLFLNDPRIPASAYIKTLPPGTSLEHTFYPPSLPSNHFEREHNYPIYFVKTQGETVPTSKQYEFNVGEIGLDERQTAYLVTDSFTYERFSDPYICANVQVECDFFKQLDTGRSSHYKLVSEFSYSLPPWLPQMRITFVNPVIRIYERIP